MKEKAELPSFLLEHNPWEGEVNPIWPASIFILHRNLAKYSFPPKMNGGISQQTINLLSSALLNMKELDRPLFLKTDEISPLDKEYLFEHFLCLEGFQSTLNGQGFVIDHSARFLALLNIQDHLQLQLIDSQGNIEDTWNRLIKIETSLGNSLDFAYSPKWGYLTSDPTASGTGLVVLIYLHLPALIHTDQLSEILIKQKDEEVEATSMEGGLEEIVGDLLILRNRYTIGLTEENILRSLQSTAMKLILAEKTARFQLRQEKNPAIKDQVSRSYGLLTHSYQLQTKEALANLSLLKLGVDLGWVTGISDNRLNEIFFKCRRGHLTHAFKEKEIDQQDLPRKRAEILHASLKDVQLNLDN